jgi:2-oxo-4-hydroxy-4-carboxy-5-ureidoimidazoline decarboxylase
MAVQPDSPPALQRFNVLPPDEARELLLACCASTAWADQVLDARPFDTAEDLLDVAEQCCRRLGDDDVAEALDAHPRIGDRAEGARQEARWSRQEQSAVSGADERTRDELREGNLRYEERFGQVFLIRAAGRAPDEMLAELRRRLANDPATERREVHEQLCEITRLRVERLVSS